MKRVEDFGKQLKAARKKAGYTQHRLSEESGVCRQYIIAVEKGAHSPSVAVASKLLRVLGAKLEVKGNVHHD